MKSSRLLAAAALLTLSLPALAGNSPYIKLTSPADGAILAPARDQWIPLRYSVDLEGIRNAKHTTDPLVPFLTVVIPGPTPSSPGDIVLTMQLSGADLTGHNVSSNDILDKLNAAHRPLDTPIIWNILIHTPKPANMEASESKFSFRMLKKAGDPQLTAKSPGIVVATPKPTQRPIH